MAIKDWKNTINQRDYYVWTKGKKTIAVFKNSFTTPSGRRYIKKSIGYALTQARNYRERN